MRATTLRSAYGAWLAAFIGAALPGCGVAAAPELDASPTPDDAGVLLADSGPDRSDAGGRAARDAGPPDPSVLLYNLPESEDDPSPYGPHPRHLLLAPEGGFYASFVDWRHDAPSRAFILRLERDGSIRWQRVLQVEDDTGLDYFAAVADEITGELVLGYTTTAGLVVARIGDDGEPVRATRIEVPGRTFNADDDVRTGPVVLVTHEDGDVTVAASLRYIRNDIFIARLDPDGALRWQHVYASPDYAPDFPGALAVAPDGGYLLVGGTAGYSDDERELLGRSAEPPRVLALRLDDAGRPLFATVFGTDDIDEIRHVIPDGSSGFLMAGSTNGVSTPWLVALRSDGLVMRSRGYAMGLSHAGFGQWIFRDRDGDLLFVGAPDWLLELSADGSVRRSRELDSRLAGAAIDGDEVVTLGAPPPCSPSAPGYERFCAGTNAYDEAMFVRHPVGRAEGCSGGLYMPWGTARSGDVPIQQTFPEIEPEPVEAVAAPHELTFVTTPPFEALPQCLPRRR